MEKQDAVGLRGNVAALREMIAGEIQAEREHQRLLRSGGARGWLTLSILAASVILNLVFLFEDVWYPIYFIIASFFIFMFYFCQFNKFFCIINTTAITFRTTTTI